MPKFKINNGSSWVNVNGGDCESTNDLRFRAINSKLQYSNDNINWNEVGMDNSVVMLCQANGQISIGQTVSISNGIASLSATLDNINGIAVSNTSSHSNEILVCVDGIATILNSLIAGNVYYSSAVNSCYLTENIETSGIVGIALSSTKLLLTIPNRTKVL